MKPKEPLPLLDWVKEQIRKDRFASWAAVAREVKKDQGAMKRAMQDGQIGLETVLRLAKLTGEPASHLLALARKTELNALIESLYGVEPVRLSRDHQAVIAFLQDPDTPELDPFRQQVIQAARGLELLRRRLRPTAPPDVANEPVDADIRKRRGTQKK